MTEAGALGIKGELVKRVCDALQTACIDDIPDNDVTKAAYVGIGSEYSGSMDRARIVILSLDTRPEDSKEWRDDRSDSVADLGFQLPDSGMGMIGHKRFDQVRGSVLTRINLSAQATSVPPSTAMEIRQTLRARVRHTLDTDRTLVGFFDDYGSGVQNFQVSRITVNDLLGGNAEIFVDWTALVTVPTRQRNVT